MKHCTVSTVSASNPYFYQKPSIIKNGRIAGLDVVRSIAILAVVVSHSSEFLLRMANVPHFGNAIRGYVSFVQPLGPLGVELFFVLSGFLIGNILIKTFMNTGFSFSDVRTFWVRRWFRTLPLYWLILTTDIILYYALDLKSHELPKIFYYFFLQNLWRPHPRYFFGEAWSLSIEEWFYITLPIAMYISAHIFRPVNKKSFLLKVFTGYLSVFLLIRFINAFHPINGPDLDSGIRKVVLFRLDAVMYGVLFAYFNTYSRQSLDKIKNMLLLTGIAGTVIIYYLFLDTSINITASTQPAIRFAGDAFLYLLIPLFFSLCLPFANSISTISNKYLSRFFTHISKISYSMYLVHYSLVFIPFFNLMKATTPVATVAFYILYWFTVISLSSVLYKYFEYPVMRLRDKFAGRHESST